MRLIDANEIKWYGCNFEGGRACVKANGDCNKCTYAECDADQVRNLPAVNAIVIPDNATNGDMIKAMFPNVEIYTVVINEIVDVEICEDRSELRCSVDWWNSPYRKEQE